MKIVVRVLCLSFSLLMPLHGQSQTAPPSTGTPLGMLLNPDGTLKTNTGFSGSVNARGWRMAGGKNSAPRFVPAGVSTISADSLWDGQFGYVDQGGGVIYALAVDGTNIYAGGNFTMEGGVSAAHIAKWDGTTWSPLGLGLNATPQALCVIGTDLYAGGSFSQAGGAPASNIAKWDGSTWSALGSGTDGTVDALAAIGTNLYVGGFFTHAGGVSAQFIAKWDGSTWSALGSGMDNSVFALATNGTILYAGGWFSTAGGSSASNIAQWNGTSWSALGSGTDDQVLALAFVGTTLYAGGKFSHAGGISAKYVARWNGGWNQLGSGVNSFVHGIAAIGTDIYVGGDFSIAGGINVKYIARWNGSSWSAVGSGTRSNVVCLAASSTTLYTGEGIQMNCVEQWDGSRWSAVISPGTPNGLNGDVYALAVSNGNVYAGGLFNAAGGVTHNFIAKWDGHGWSNLGSGMNAAVFALAVNGSDIYAGGAFVVAGGATAYYIARWDGSVWSPMGSGMNGNVRALAVVGTDVYAAGEFTTAGGIAANYIAKWDGSSWSNVGSGMSGPVYSLASIGSQLYAGGGFSVAGGVSANNIARWNGSSWSSLGTGTDAAVYAMAASGTDLYVGGHFLYAGGVSASAIAKWNGTTWSALGSGMSYASPIPLNVRGLAVNGSGLFAAGFFTGAGGTGANNIARWNGSSWSALGSGITTMNDVYSLAFSGKYLYAGGYFFMAGGMPSSNFGRYQFGQTITPTSGPHGSVTPGAVNIVSIGGSDTLTFLPDSGYHVDSVIVDGSYIGSPTSYIFSNVVSDHTIEITFAIDVFSLTATAGPHGTITPAGVTMVDYDSSQTYTITPDVGFLVEDLFVDTMNAGSATSYTFAHVRRNHTIEAHFTNIQAVQTDIRNGWNLVSVPLRVNNNTKDSLFSTSVSNAFAYQTTYLASPTLTAGRGYWLKFSSDQSVNLYGNRELQDSIDVVQGWNLIGSISSPVPTSTIESVPGGIVTSQYFGYAGSYRARDTIAPGSGYWVKVGQAGKLILSSVSENVPSGNLARIRPTSEFPPSPPSGLGTESMSLLPTEFGLEQNYPNPFNPTTIISYALPVDAQVVLKVYNILGQVVATLVDNVEPAGYRNIEWNAGNVASGIYFYKVEASPVVQPVKGFMLVRKMQLVK